MIRIGTDIEDLSRISKVNKEHQLAQRILSSKEYDYYIEQNEIRQTEFLAGRFCAKEAIIKALDEEITMNKIHLVFTDNELIMKHPTKIIKVSISHTNTTALAMAIVYENS
ncbi:MAG TPA: 4'-phosphopantetheinyl transferase superfamily protein [Erysipelothrix sp.]|jgi:holo-[acyl-carrier protein] synthase|nr:4'-phosphopantetheinyl transferase superfamily protein [Erysipelothrix sp.]